MLIKIDKLKLWIYTLLSISILATAIISIAEGNWKRIGISILMLLLITMPQLIEKKLKLKIPSELELVTVLFIYSSIFLGDGYRFYDKFWWWDKMLHSFSGPILGIMGILLINYLNKRGQLNINLSPIFGALTSFFFAVTAGALWEIYEYTMDKVIGSFMQRGSLNDTMTDLILDTIGASIVAIIYYIKKNRVDSVK